jgi:hypothetical protein
MALAEAALEEDGYGGGSVRVGGVHVSEGD